MLTFGTGTGSLSAFTANTTTNALLALDGSGCWCEFIYAHDQLFS
jgi:hypothetical protein